MPTLPDACFDLVITDPPFLVDYTPRDGRTVANDRSDSWLLPAFTEVYRLLKAHSLCVSFYGWPHVDVFMRAWKHCGFSPVSHVVCVKDYSSRSGYTRSHHEVAYVLAKGHPAKPMRPPMDVLPWRYTGNHYHPTQKPVSVIRTLIEAFSRPNDVVLDPFAGSGTTAVAAHACGRRFVLIEKVWRVFRDSQLRLDREIRNARTENKGPSKPR